MKLFRNALLSLLGFLLIQSSYAVPGLFFNVTSQGGGLFEVRTNVPTHPLPYNTAGLVINTLGFSAVSGAGVNCNSASNICAFSQIGNNLPISVNLTGPVGQPVDLVLCLNLRGGQSCQHYTVSIASAPSPKQKRAYITNTSRGINAIAGIATPQSVSKCDVDELNNLINCSLALQLPSSANPIYVVANTANNFVYIVNSGLTSQLLRCAIAANGDLINCADAIDPTIQILALTFNAAQTIAYVSTDDGNVFNCPIDATGNLTCASPVNIGGVSLSDIERNPNPALNYVYVVEPALNSTELYKCTIGGSGIISGCDGGVTLSGFIRNLVANPAGTFVYLSAIGVSTNNVMQCPINQTTGSVDSLNCVETPFNGPWGLSFNAAGDLLYVVDNSLDTVDKCSIDSADGSIILPCVPTANDLIGPVGIALLNF